MNTVYKDNKKEVTRTLEVEVHKNLGKLVRDLPESFKSVLVRVNQYNDFCFIAFVDSVGKWYWPNGKPLQKGSPLAWMDLPKVATTGEVIYGKVHNIVFVKEVLPEAFKSVLVFPERLKEWRIGYINQLGRWFYYLLNNYNNANIAQVEEERAAYWAELPERVSF